jgi:hypothetical protein
MSHNSIQEEKREQVGIVTTAVPAEIDKGQSCPYSGLCQKEEKILVYYSTPVSGLLYGFHTLS